MSVVWSVCVSEEKNFILEFGAAAAVWIWIFLFGLFFFKVHFSSWHHSGRNNVFFVNSGSIGPIGQCVISSVFRIK